MTMQAHIAPGAPLPASFLPPTAASKSKLRKLIDAHKVAQIAYLWALDIPETDEFEALRDQQCACLGDAALRALAKIAKFTPRTMSDLREWLDYAMSLAGHELDNSDQLGGLAFSNMFLKGAQKAVAAIAG